MIPSEKEIREAVELATSDLLEKREWILEMDKFVRASDLELVYKSEKKEIFKLEILITLAQAIHALIPEPLSKEELVEVIEEKLGVAKEFKLKIFK